MPRPASAGRTNHTWKETRHGAPPFVSRGALRCWSCWGFSSPAASAAPIQFTGNVAERLQPGDQPQRRHVTPVSSNPLNIGQSSWITTNGWISGWSIQDIRTNYDATTDTLSVGVNTSRTPADSIAPFGQANGDPSGTPTGYDPAHLGGDKSVALAIAPVNPTNLSQPGTPVVVAGVPGRQDDRRHRHRRLHGLRVTTPPRRPQRTGLRSSARACPRTRATWPSIPRSSHPQLEFTIKNFSKIPGLDPSTGLLDLGVRRLEPGRRRGRSLPRPGRRSPPTPSRTSPSPPPGWPGRSRPARQRCRLRRSGGRAVKLEVRSVKPIVINASLRKAAAWSRVAALVHRPLPAPPSLPFSHCGRPCSVSPLFTVQVPGTAKIARLALPFNDVRLR